VTLAWARRRVDSLETTFGCRSKSDGPLSQQGAVLMVKAPGYGGPHDEPITGRQDQPVSLLSREVACYRRGVGKLVSDPSLDRDHSGDVCSCRSVDDQALKWDWRRRRSVSDWPACQPRARTGRKPETLTSTGTPAKSALASIAAVEFRPGIDMVRRRSTDRWSSPTCAKRRVPIEGSKRVLRGHSRTTSDGD
jgi:hypothetical protein